MSGIFGVHSGSGDTAALARFGRIQQAMLYWTPDRQDEVLLRFACLGYLAREATPEDAFDHQPFSFNEFREELHITADVRLDNREGLLGLLGDDSMLSGRAPETIPDSEILLAAYRAWGVDCPQKLLGDFVFAIWDAEKQELFCVRDHMGVKPFYYFQDGDLFCFANDMRGLSAAGSGPLPLDQAAIASYLKVGELLDVERTFIEGIKKLPPASFIKVSNGRLEQGCYWRPEDAPPVKAASMDEYAHKLRELIEDAVRVRLRRTGPLACHLSGGIDSSVVTAVAAGMEKQTGRDVYSYNWAHSPGVEDDPGEAEWANSQMLAGHLGIHHEHIELSEDELVRQLEQRDLAAHTTSDAFYETPLRRAASEEGVRVILSGWGGDELISNSGRRRYCGELSRGRWLSALGGLYEASGPPAGRPRRFAASCYYELFRPLVKWFVYRVPPFGGAKFENYLGCAKPAIRAVAKRQPLLTYDGSRLTVRADQLALVGQGHLQNRMESWANAGRPDGIEYRYPLLDKRVVEFALGLPAECYRQGNTKRFLMREASGGLLPESLRWGELKVERQRVKRLLELLENTCIHWYAERGRGMEPDLIDTAQLRRCVEKVERFKSDSFSHRVRNCMTVHKSLLVMNAGRKQRY